MLEQKVVKEPNKKRDSTPIRVSNALYEWIRLEAFMNRDSIKSLTDTLLEEAIQAREEKKIER